MKSKYLFLTVGLFGIEVLIAFYLHDKWIRPFLGDVLVVILIYAFIRIFYERHTQAIAIGVLLFACAIEIGQYYQLATLLGLEHNKLAKIVIGSTFDWWDIIAYLTGTLITLRLDKVFHQTS